MHLSKFLPILASFIRLTLTQKADEKVDVLIPVGNSIDEILVVKATVPLPDLEKEMEDPGYSPAVYSETNITDIGWTFDFMESLNNTDGFHPGVNCINCDTKNRAVLDIYQLNRLGYCSCGWCRYPYTCCWYNICGRYWYNCIPDCFKPKPPIKPTKTSRKPHTTSSTKPPTSSKIIPTSSSSSIKPPTSSSTSSRRPDITLTPV
ncbi:hypothetical protein AYI70_g6026 [Smittium culicis]|uniref:Chitin-binding type-1 domain-containing protein n=1 Tax=Smittium culicis TaxID=133412 RepID=A0A1R1XRU2_9FUNG|nr:hypothetical protein AYI70_g6026 [Smittium culicis]